MYIWLFANAMSNIYEVICASKPQGYGLGSIKMQSTIIISKEQKFEIWVLSQMLLRKIFSMNYFTSNFVTVQKNFSFTPSWNLK